MSSCDTIISTNLSDQSENGLPQRVKSTDGTWSASASLQMMVIHADGSYAAQQFDGNSASGTGMTASGAAGFFGMGRAIPDGQGGSLLTLSSPAALYHGSTKFPLPITPTQVFDGFFDDGPMLVGEDGTAYITGSSDPNGQQDTVLALDTTNGATKWSVSPGFSPKLSTLTADGTVVFQYVQSDFSKTRIAVANSSAQVSALFADNTNGSDVGPALTVSDPQGPLYLGPDTWFMPENDGGVAVLTRDNAPIDLGSRPQHTGNSQQQNVSPAAAITVHFTCVSFPSCPLTNGDMLHFQPTDFTSQACTETLGPADCVARTGAWIWNVEVKGVVSDDASKWQVQQSVIAGKTAGTWINPDTGEITPFSNPIFSARDDTPLPQFLQQPAGQNKIFWIDSPGTPIALLSPDRPIDSMIAVKNFISTICSKTAPDECVSVKWYTKLVVKNGALDAQQSIANFGQLPLDF